MHGEDTSVDQNGKDVYQFVKDMGRFQNIKRTDGISTSEIILRIIKEYDGMLYCVLVVILILWHDG